MEQQWMIYASEATGDHYWYNGDLPVFLEPMAGIGRVVLTMTDEQEALNTALNTPRQRLIILNKARYVVVARGKRYEP